MGAGSGVTVNATAVAVNPNTGIVANATGVFVNSAYIATIAANSATFANSSVTNTFTVGTSSYFVANGNVGIGISSPTTKLQIAGSISSTVSVTETHTSTGFQYKESFSDHVAQSKKSSNTYAYYWRTTDDGTVGGANSKTIAEWYNDKLIFNTSNIERMRIDTSGNVGIGNTAPTEKLHVEGKIRIGTQATATTDAVRADRGLTAGDGLTGGGNLTADRTFTLGTPSSLTGSTLNAVTATSHTHAITVDLGVTNGTTAGPVITSSAGTNATIPTASATISGAVTTGAQTWAGVKTFNSTISGSINGNAGTATTLQTARTINGVSFNGSANITVADATKLPLAGGTMTGLLIGRESVGTDVNTMNDAGSFSVRSNASNAASISFHRVGAFAINMGLGTDNVFRIGGWSASNNALQLTGAGVLTALGTVNAPTFNATSATDGGFQGITTDSASIPSFTWTGNLNTGIFHPGTNLIGFTTNGGERVRIDATGNVGIGTSSPKAYTTWKGNDGASIIGWNAPNNGIGSNIYFSGGWKYYANGVGNVLKFSDVGDFEFYSAPTNALGADAGATPTERMRITSAGNVGIGTTSPGCSLQVNGGIRARGGAPGAGGVNNNGYAFSGNSGDNDSGMFSSADGQLEFYGNSAERMRLSSAGNLGIGTASPGQRLEVSGTGLATTDFRAPIFYDSNNTAFYTDPASTSIMNTITYTLMNGPATNTRDKLRVWNSSQYAIGMTNGFTFGSIANDYAMTFQMNNSNARGFWWGDDVHTAAQGAMALSTEGRLTVAHSIRVGHGESDTTIPGATYRLDVSGDVGATGNITAYYSDIRLKEIVSNIDNPIEIIKSLRGFKYRNNETAKQYGYNDDKIQIGLSAQEVEAVLPEIISIAPFDAASDGDGNIVSKSGENYRTLDYAKLVPVLIEAIKEQQVTIEQLKTDINTLKGIR